MKLNLLVILIYILGGYSKDCWDNKHFIISTIISLLAAGCVLYVTENYKEKK